MEAQKKLSITVDLRQDTMIPLPQFIQNDTNVLELTVKEKGVAADLINITRIVANYRRPDKTVISRLLTAVENVVSYEIGLEEMEVSGPGEMEIQFFENENRISTKRFKVNMLPSIGTDAIYENTEDMTLLQTLFVEVDTVKTETETARNNADAATTAANTAATNAQQVADENKTRFLPAVATVADRDTTYPAPAHGDTVRVTGEARTYRFDSGSGWVVTDQYNPTAIDEVNVKLADVAKRYVNIDKYESLKVAVAEGFDYAPVIQKALTDHKNIVITGDYLVGRVVPKSNQEILLFGNLSSLSGATNCMFEISSVNNVTIKGIGTINGNTQDTYNGIKLTNTSGTKVYNLTFTGFKNKAISISGTSEDCVIFRNKIEGSNGVSGAGVSLFGQGVKNCKVLFNTVKTSRIGISLNGGEGHQILGNNCRDNVEMGIGLDGIVTGSGDGTKNTVVSLNIVTGTTGTNYAGIYLGNGSSGNTVQGNICNSNARTGIRITSVAGQEITNCILTDNVCRFNGYHGLEFGYTKGNTISNNDLSDNTQRGLAGTYFDDNLISNNNIRRNAQEGLFIQGGKNKISDNKSKGNNKGLVIAYGGSSPTSNVISENDFTENTTSSVETVDVNTYRANEGYKTENRGTFTFSGTGAQTNVYITHGLAVTPKFFIASPASVDAGNAGVKHISATATHIIITFNTPPIAGTSNVAFSWKAEQ